MIAFWGPETCGVPENLSASAGAGSRARPSRRAGCCGRHRRRGDVHRLTAPETAGRSGQRPRASLMRATIGPEASSRQRCTRRLVVVDVSTSVCWFGRARLSLAEHVMIYLLGVLLMAARLQRRPAIVGCLASASQPAAFPSTHAAPDGKGDGIVGTAEFLAHRPIRVPRAQDHFAIRG